MRFRYSKAPTSQTTKQISTRVPISLYPNIVASYDPKIVGFRDSMSHFALLAPAIYVAFGAQSQRFVERVVTPRAQNLCASKCDPTDRVPLRMCLKLNRYQSSGLS
jgi:hypothetical protein